MMIKRYFKTGKIYHIFNKSIANFTIFGKDNSQRFLNVLDYYNNRIMVESFSNHLQREKKYTPMLLLHKSNAILKIIAYCIMPDHYHLLIKLLGDDELSTFISNIENSYTRYFNLKHKRKGPLWQSRFKSVLIKTNEQLLHVSRYIHLNPTTSYLVEKPEDWQFSSYRDFVANELTLQEIIPEISISNPLTYQKFVEDQIDYQRKLKVIKKLILE